MHGYPPQPIATSPDSRPQATAHALAALALAIFATATAPLAAVWTVADGDPVQAAIDAAEDGDTIALGVGTYPGDIDFAGKAITVVGTGPETVLAGSGTGPVVRFTSGEGPGSVLDSVTVTGGIAASGGGILIANASPQILRSVIRGNRAAGAGSGIYINGATAAPLIANNLIIDNATSGLGDPHAVQTRGSSPRVVNNTIAYNDSNGVFTSGGGAAEIRSNILARNGSRGDATTARRGRGICNFVASTLISHNLFFRNARSALLQGATDYPRISRAERAVGGALLRGNSDGRPRFLGRALGRRIDRAVAADFELRAGSRALAAGDPDPTWNDLDGAPNTAGHLGGPYAARP
jgi:hypothetical protein